MGLRDKFEITVVRNYLWNNHKMSLKPVHNSMSLYDSTALYGIVYDSRYPQNASSYYIGCNSMIWYLKFGNYTVNVTIHHGMTSYVVVEMNE